MNNSSLTMIHIIIFFPYECEDKIHLNIPHRMLENRFFHRSLYLIPGLKTCPRGVRVSPEKAVLVNNVRGEETEIMGILQATGMDSCAVLLPGSHTQAAIVENGKITD